jgi:phosphohistidine phosphatase
MKLYLMQHGEAEAEEVDPERPLSARGRQEVQAMAALLAASGVQVERVWHSGKLRAVQTAQILAGKLLPAGKAESIDGIRPNDPVEAFVADADVWELDTLVVGHLPFMSRLVAQLVLADPRREVVNYLPGSVVCLERRAADAWVLDWMVRPDVLARGAVDT